MMEPVAWRLRWIYPATGQATSWAATTDEYVAQQKERDGLEVDPLVPQSALSDAEARIAELEARVKELEAAKWQVRHVDTANDLVSMGMARDAAEARAEAAEALLKEAWKVLEPFAKLGSVISATQQYRMFLQVMVCPFGDNHPNDYRPHLEAARAISDKIGVKDE